MALLNTKARHKSQFSIILQKNDIGSILEKAFVLPCSNLDLSEKLKS